MTKKDLLLADFRSEVPEPDDATGIHIYQRVMAAQRRGAPGRLAVSVPRRRGIIAAFAAAALGFAGGASAIAYHYLGPSPGFTAGFAAFANRPAVTWPDSLPQVALKNSAAYAGVPETEFLQRLRVLRTELTLGPGLSQGQGALYAYVSEDGRTACLFLTGQTGACFNPSDAPDVQGVFPVISGGYPGQAPALIAIVADSVVSVELDISNQLRDLPIVSNSIYVDLEDLGSADTISLHVSYKDGSTADDSLPNPLRGKVSP